MLKAVRRLLFGDKPDAEDKLSTLMKIKNPQRAWDSSPSLGDLMAMKSNMRDIPVSDAQQGWKISDALNAMGILSWFSKPGQKKGLVVHYKYGHDLSPEEIAAVLEEYGSTAPDQSPIVAEVPVSQEGTVVMSRSSKEAIDEKPLTHETRITSESEANKIEADLLKKGYVVTGHKTISAGRVEITFFNPKDLKVV